MQVYRSVPTLQLLAKQALRTTPVLFTNRNFFFGTLIKAGIDLTCLTTGIAAVRRRTGLDLKPITDTIKNDTARNIAQGYLFVGEKCADAIVVKWEKLTGAVKKKNEKYQREYQDQDNEYNQKSKDIYNKYYDQFHRYQTASSYDQSKHSYPETRY